MVGALVPVISVILFAALPVGAARRMFGVSLPETLRIALVMVLLPVPGPPVIISFSECCCNGFFLLVGQLNI